MNSTIDKLNSTQDSSTGQIHFMRNLAAVITAEAVSGPGNQSGSLCSPGAAELPFEATAEEHGRAQQGTHATSTPAVLPSTRTIHCLSTPAVQGLKWLPPKF